MMHASASMMAVVKRHVNKPCVKPLNSILGYALQEVWSWNGDRRTSAVSTTDTGSDHKSVARYVLHLRLGTGA